MQQLINPCDLDHTEDRAEDTTEAQAEGRTGGQVQDRADGPGSLAALAATYAYPAAVGHGRPWLRANMVSGLDGAARLEGLSEGLSSEADKRIFGVLRALADVVLVGAETVRAEGYRPGRARKEFAAARAAAGQAPAPVIAVVTRSLDLDLTAPLFTEPLVPTVVIAPVDAPIERLAEVRAVAEVITAGSGSVDLAVATAALAARGWTRQLTEGGPRLLAQLAAAGLLDELCLSLAPLLTGGDAPRILHGAQMPDVRRMRLVSLIEEKGFLFTRYLRYPRPDDSAPSSG
ncbi:diaminohydroxyphosphoribosylaminopyrimidine reductase [Kitasatospora sp. MMS16-BH015]|uniref:dihydrofolate reductase family protein n=1 Tax=Kitasatospora sp. MMS16-BH015 TaxID=2018025 RepID=UPI000CA1FE52|nr:dihydrofolate reductase family protein [Kitasatospora sp. MMS16-BH015]AUG80118.1 diaminohydroxyphosphoribosylaminopyrimidine reductase [Kitasatospora sp. MMS16-BH015]